MISLNGAPMGSGAARSKRSLDEVRTWPVKKVRRTAVAILAQAKGPHILYLPNDAQRYSFGDEAQDPLRFTPDAKLLRRYVDPYW
jgi:hypothetical protein